MKTLTIGKVNKVKLESSDLNKFILGILLLAMQLFMCAVKVIMNV